MSTRSHAIFAAVLISVVVGAGLGTALVLGPTIPQQISAEMAIEALGMGGFASIWVSLPLGVVGGVFAAAMLTRAPNNRTSVQWAVLGGVSGAVLGGVGSALYSAAINGANFPAMSGFLVLGGVAGIICGVAMGVWCAKQARLVAVKQDRLASRPASAA